MIYIICTRVDFLPKSPPYINLLFFLLHSYEEYTVVCDSYVHSSSVYLAPDSMDIFYIYKLTTDSSL